MTRTVLITGCSSGIGKASAHLFAERGWNVIATVRNPEAGAELAQLERVAVTRLDVQNPASIDRAVSEGIKRFGRIDAVVNNAGFGVIGIFEAISRERVQEQFEVNTFGTMNVIRTVLPHFRANRAGVIINVSSGAGIFGVPMTSLYVASKFAIEGFSEALAYELSAIGVTVKIVEPGTAPSTAFGARAFGGRGPETLAAGVPADYHAFIPSAVSALMGIHKAAEDNAIAKIAEAIFVAATDGSDQLRYLPNDDIKPFTTARRETSEQEYMAFVRKQFGGH